MCVCVCVCRKGLRDLINPIRSLFANKKQLTVRLNVKAIGLTKLGKAQRMIGLLCAALKVTSCNP